jgi:hypothetical protein
MANRYVRLYKGIEGNDETVIGFSRSVADAPDSDTFQTFMSERGYTAREVLGAERPIGSLSMRHIGIQPPMASDHVVEFGALLQRTVDVGHNAGFLIDNRLKLPDENGMGGPIITHW